MKKDYKNILMLVTFVFILCMSINVFADNTVECYGVFTEDFITALRDYVYVPIKWGTPVLLLVLTSIDFAKVVFVGKKEDMEKAKNNFLKRTVAALIIFFVPNIIDLVVSFVNQQSVASCIEKLK